MKKPVWLGLWVLMALFAAACAQAFPTIQAPEPPTIVPAETEQVAELPPTATTAAEAVEPTSEPAATEAAAATETKEVPTEAPPTAEPPTPADAPEGSSGETTPLGSPELHATDPSTVNLSSGKVQLVEFFAFW